MVYIYLVLERIYTEQGYIFCLFWDYLMELSFVEPNSPFYA